MSQEVTSIRKKQVEPFGAQPFSFVTILLQTNQLPSPL